MLSHSTVSAQTNYPERQITIIVPFPPGGSVDVLGRTIAQKLNDAWGKPVVVENRAGACTIIGTTALAKAPPDGYTLLIAVSSHTTNPSLSSKLPFDTQKDFAPITLLAKAPVVLYANPNFPPNNLKELVEHAKKETKLNFASAGVGTMTHLTAELLKASAKVEMTHIIYRGGTPAMNDLIAGHLPMSFGTVAQALPQYKAGVLKALARVVGEALPVDSGRADLQGAGLRCRHHRVVRPARAGRHAAADHRQAQRGDGAHHEVAGSRRAADGDRARAPRRRPSSTRSSRSETERWAPLIKSLNLTIE